MYYVIRHEARPGRGDVEARLGADGERAVPGHDASSKDTYITMIVMITIVIVTILIMIIVMKVVVVVVVVVIIIIM